MQKRKEMQETNLSRHGHNSLVLLLQQRVDHLGHAGPLPRGQGAVFVDDVALVGVQVVGGGGFDATGYFCMSNHIIYRCIKIIRDLYESGNIRLECVLCVF